MGRKPSNNYIDVNEFNLEMEKSKELGNLTNRAIELMTILIDRNAMRNHYKCKEDADDCKSHAMYNFLKYWKNFGKNGQTNAFSYFTSCAVTGLAQGYNSLYPPSTRDSEFYSMSLFDETSIE